MRVSFFLCKFAAQNQFNMGWKITTIRTPRVQEPKVEMTEEEFRANLVISAYGHYK